MLDKKKNILLITDVMQPGGVDTYVEQLIEYGHKNGWNITLLLDKKSKTSLPRMVKNKCRVMFKSIYHKGHSEKKIRKDFSSFIQKLTKTFIAHVICGIPWSCILVREILLDYKFCVINTEQYIYDNMSFTDSQIERIKNIYAKTYKIIYVEESNQSYMQSIFGESMNGNFCTINNSIDTKNIFSNTITLKERINRLEARTLNKSKIKFLLLGRFSYQKGFDIFIDAVSVLAQNEKDKAVFDIYGNGPELINIVNMIENKNLSNCIKIHGWTREVRSLFLDYDVFIFPSRTEGLSFTMLEALGSNIPLIVSNIPSNITLTKNGYYAETFDISNPKSLTTILSEWINRPLEKVINVPSSYDWMMKNFNSSKNIRRTIDLWDKAYEIKKQN